MRSAPARALELKQFRQQRLPDKRREKMERASFTAEEWQAHEAPTRDNQIWHARRVLNDEGAQELHRHAMVGATCGCGTCFCCAALWVYNRRHTGGM